jgi:hypothetical protein
MQITTLSKYFVLLAFALVLLMCGGLLAGVTASLSGTGYFGACAIFNPDSIAKFRVPATARETIIPQGTGKVMVFRSLHHEKAGYLTGV